MKNVDVVERLCRCICCIEGNLFDQTLVTQGKDSDVRLIRGRLERDEMKTFKQINGHCVSEVERKYSILGVGKCFAIVYRKVIGRLRPTISIILVHCGVRLVFFLKLLEANS